MQKWKLTSAFDQWSLPLILHFFFFLPCWYRIGWTVQRQSWGAQLFECTVFMCLFYRSWSLMHIHYLFCHLARGRGRGANTYVQDLSIGQLRLVRSTVCSFFFVFYLFIFFSCKLVNGGVDVVAAFGVCSFMQIEVVHVSFTLETRSSLCSLIDIRICFRSCEKLRSAKTCKMYSEILHHLNQFLIKPILAPICRTCGDRPLDVSANKKIHCLPNPVWLAEK